MRYMGPEGTSHTSVRSPEGEERRWAEAVFEELMSENFPKPVKKKKNTTTLSLKTKSQQNPSRINTKELTLSHVSQTAESQKQR